MHVFAFTFNHVPFHPAVYVPGEGADWNRLVAAVVCVQNPIRAHFATRPTVEWSVVDAVSVHVGTKISGRACANSDSMEGR